MGSSSSRQKDGAPTPDSGSEDELYNRDPVQDEASRLLDKDQNPEDPEKKQKYPFSVFFIIGNEFCERFSFYGMKAVLTLYFVNIFGWSDNTATVIYHSFVMLCYFTPLIGAVISDTYLGKFRTIFYISIIYAVGSIILALAATSPLNLPHVQLSLLGLFLIGLGTGGIKPCVAAFGGDQFLPSQEKQQQRFFSVFYFAINTGSLISIFLTPVLRKDVHCFGDSYCFPLAFGVPAVLMITSLLLFLLGKPLYRMVPPGGAVLVDVAKCIGLGISGKFGATTKREHWLDHAKEKYPANFVEDVKAVTRVLFLYIPLPIFWSLFDQQGSRWTLQATRMDGLVAGSWVLKPDQMGVINPLFILAMIPFFDMMVYPTLARCNLLVKPLHRIVVGGFLAACAFVIAGFVQIALENTFPIAPADGTSQFNVINLSPCNITVNLTGSTGSIKTFDISSTKNQTFEPVGIKENYTSYVTFICGGIDGLQDVTREEKQIVPENGKSLLIPIAQFPSDNKIEKLQMEESRTKPKDGKSNIMLIHSLLETAVINSTLSLRGHKEKESYEFLFNNASSFGLTSYKLVEPDTYDVYVPNPDTTQNDTVKIGEITTHQGAAYSLLLYQSSKSFRIELLESVAPNSLRMLWQIPQYFVITLAEIMFSITGLSFSYSQAPASMKSVLQAAWLLTVAFGNAIVIIIAEVDIFDRQSYEFFLFSCLMGLDMIVFMLMARSYIYVNQPSADDDEQAKEKNDSLPKNGVGNDAFVEDTKM